MALLRRIEADRAIPRAENAALAYRRLDKDPNAASLLDDAATCAFLTVPDSLDDVIEYGPDPNDIRSLLLHAETRILYQRSLWHIEHWNTAPETLIKESFRPALWEPWTSGDNPELAAEMVEKQSVLRGLLAVSQFDQCWFRLPLNLAPLTSEARMHALMRRWALLLCLAANNSLAEDRVEEAIAYWQCLIRMSDHLRQQPRLYAHLLAGQIARLVFVNMMRFIVTTDPREATLQQIETMSLPTEDQWLHYLGEVRVAEKLVVRALSATFGGRRSVLDRLKDILPGGAPVPHKQAVARVRREYRGQVATARAIRILIALRRYQQTTGQWPERLDDVRKALPRGALIDPFNGARFVYRRTEDAFDLYSAGENKLDERRKTEGKSSDDWPIWPPTDDTPPPGKTGEPQERRAR